MERSIQALQKESKALRATIRRGGPLLDAYLYRTRIRCGKPGCRCVNPKYRHGLWCLSYVTDGKSHTRTVPDTAVPEVQALCDHYRRLRRHRKQVLLLTERVAAAVDRYVQRQATKGWQRFEALKARPQSCRANTAIRARKRARKQ